jgi:transposase
VQRVIEGGESPEVVVRALGFHRSVMYQWLAKFRNGGMAALEEKPVPGRPTKLRPAQLQRLYQLVVGKNPLQLRFAYALWTRAMIQELIWREWQVSLSESAVGRLLRRMGLSPQKPLYRAYQQNPEAVQHWREVEFPAIQKLAKQKGAEIFFCDESGIRSDYHSGTTWAAVGQTPVVKSSGSRFSLNMVSAISAKGSMRFMVVAGRMNGERFMAFLKRLIHNAGRPIFLVVDGHPSHRAKIVTQFVESTEGRLQLFFLPGYSPQLNPDEFVWKYVKHQKVGRQTVTDKADLTVKVMRCLRSLQKLPALVRSFFRAPAVAYAAL